MAVSPTERRLRWAGLLVAVAAMVAAVWVLLYPDRPARHERGQPTAESADDSRSPTAAAGLQGVAAREVTIDGDGVVEGYVVDEDGQPVGDGRLVLWCLQPDGTVARIRGGDLPLSEEGHFKGPACRGQVCPQLQHTSEIPAHAWSLDPGSPQTLSTQSLPRLSGLVVDPQGQPVAAARVVFTIARDDDDPSVVLPVTASQTSTDDDGVFSVARITRPPCDPCQEARGLCLDDVMLPVADRVVVGARAAGFAPGSIEIDLLEVEGEVEVRLGEAGAAIVGTLTDSAGQAAPRAIVLARSEEHPQQQHRSEAADGTFAFEAVGEGTFSVRAIQDGIELLRREGVESGATLSLVLPQALADVELRLVDEEGDPWAGVQVRGGPFAPTRSDPAGMVRVERVAPGTYILRLRTPGDRVRAYDMEVPPGVVGRPTQVEVVLPRGTP